MAEILIKSKESFPAFFFSQSFQLSSAVAGCPHHPGGHQGPGLGQHESRRTPVLPASASLRWARQLTSQLPLVPSGWTNTNPSHQEFTLSRDPLSSTFLLSQGLGTLPDAP